MSGATAIVCYPPPTDVAAFDQVYADEHVPLAKRIPGVSRITSTTVVGAMSGASPYHRIVLLHFPSMEALQAGVASPAGQAAVAHAGQISTGGAPTVLVAEGEQEYRAS